MLKVRRLVSWCTLCKVSPLPIAPRPRAKIPLRRELTIFEEFVDFDDHPDQGAGFSWERLIRLQHFGVPTRLLDWTEILGYALFFAVRSFESKEPRSPAVWITNPFTLAKLARRSNDKRIGMFHRTDDYDYFERFLSGQRPAWPYKAPIPYRPPKLTPRIRAQRGFFTVHGTDRRPLDAIFPRAVRQVRLPLEALAGARNFLTLAGIDSLAMFPDYEGFARKLREKYE
jgi:hypothetical protein